MKKVLLIALLFPFLLEAQSPKDNLLGHYTGIAKYSCSLDTSYYCNTTLDITFTANYPVVYVVDSSCWTQVIGNSYVFDDSTIVDTTFQNNHGRLFPNDSLYFAWQEGITTCYIEFFGFKQYGFPAPVGIKEHDNFINNTILYPQPAIDVLTLKSEEAEFTEGVPPLLYDIMGREMETLSYYIDRSNYNIDLSMVASGIFWIEIRTENGIARKKVIITK